MKTFVRYQDGTCSLEEGDELVWASDEDDDFLEEFDATIDSEDISDVLDYLCDAGYLDDGESVDVEDEADDDTATINTKGAPWLQ